MGEYRFNWHEEEHGQNGSFKSWLIPTLLADSGGDRVLFEALSEATEKWTDVNVTVAINGIEVDPTDFFESIERNLTYLTERAAAKLVSEDARLQEIYEATEAYNRAIRWETRLALGRLGIELREDDI